MKKIFLTVIFFIATSLYSADLQKIILLEKKLNELNKKLIYEEQKLNSFKSFKKNSGKDLLKMSSVLSRPVNERMVENQVKSMKIISELKSEIDNIKKEISDNQLWLSNMIISGNYNEEIIKISFLADKIKTFELLNYKFLESYKIDINDKSTSLDFLNNRQKKQEKALNDIKDMIRWLNTKKNILSVNLSEEDISLIDFYISKLNEAFIKGQNSQQMILNLIKEIK